MSISEIYSSMIQSRVKDYRDYKVKPWSKYNSAVVHSPGRVTGNSRVWGDALPEAQSKVIDGLISSSERVNLSPRQIAYVLATARVESGFNPDAAAGTTSAYGLGQFTKDTAAAYGMNSANHDDLRVQADALVAHYQDNAALARSRGKGEEYIYKYHHDGPSKEYGGLDIARREVTPYLDRYERFVQEHQRKRGIEPLSPSAMQLAGSHVGGHSNPDIGTLRQGDHGPAVTALQTQLNALGYANAHGRALQPDGQFGAQTHDAVRAFQGEHGLKLDGIAGSITVRRLNEFSERQAQTQRVTVQPTAQLNDPVHADHALFKQAQSGVHQMDTKAGRTPDQRSDNLAAALVVAARRDGMSRIDHVSLGTDASKVFAVQGALNSPFKQITSVPTVDSLNTAIAQSTQAWDRAIQQATSQLQEQHAPQPTHQTPRQQAQPALAQGQ